MTGMRVARMARMVGISAAGVLTVSACAVSPTPVADAVIGKVTSADGDLTQNACQAIGEQMQMQYEDAADLMDTLSISDPQVMAAANSGSELGQNLSTAWSSVYTAIGAQDQEGLYAAFEQVLVVCGRAGVNMGWDE